MLSLRVADVEDGSGEGRQANRAPSDDRFEDRELLHFRRVVRQMSRPLAAATPNAQVSARQSTAAHGGYCAENTAMHPCAQLTPLN
jgi:hypothetical protein